MTFETFIVRRNFDRHGSLDLYCFTFLKQEIGWYRKG